MSHCSERITDSFYWKMVFKNQDLRGKVCVVSCMLLFLSPFHSEQGDMCVYSRVQVCNPVDSAAAAKSLQSCPTLCDPIDGSPLGSPVPGILQAAPHERLPEILVVPREKTPTGAAARGNP